MDYTTLLAAVAINIIVCAVLSSLQLAVNLKNKEIQELDLAADESLTVLLGMINARLSALEKNQDK